MAGAIAAAGSAEGQRREPDALLTWWQGGLVMLGWGLIPLTLGYFTTFRRDVT